jgi:outer membrane lipoprotein SlyB
MTTARLASIATGTVLVAMLGACANPTLPPPGPVAGYPSAYPPAAPVGLEFGRVTNIQLMAGETAARGGVNVPGAVIGGVAGAVIGNQVGRRVGSSGNRDTATVLGGVAGAAVGSQVGQPTPSGGTQPVYRVTVQTDQGALRVYDVPAPGDLRVGDRVRVDRGVIYRA